MNKVYILDFECISGLSLGKSGLLEALKKDSTPLSYEYGFPTEGLPQCPIIPIRSDLSKWHPEKGKDFKRLLHFERKLELSMAVASLFKERSSFFPLISGKTSEIFWGLGQEGFPLHELYDEFYDTGPAQFSDLFRSLCLTEHPALSVPAELNTDWIKKILNVKGNAQCILTACAASNQAIALAFDQLRHGPASFALAGGSDSLIHLLGYVAFSKMGIIHEAEGNSNPCKPLGKDRTGTILGEGASLFLLANEEQINQWGVTPLCEILGYGMSMDAYKITAPDPSGQGMERALRNNIENSRIDIDQIGYINLHGTGTIANDETELKACSRVLPNSNIPVSSTKNRHGHLIAGAGGMELSILTHAISDGFIPRTLSLKNPIDSHGFDLVSKENRENCKIKIAISNSFAFGGINSSLSIGGLD